MRRFSESYFLEQVQRRRRRKSDPLVDDLTDALIADEILHEFPMGDDILAVQIDENLDRRIWHGTTWTERNARTMGEMSRFLVGEIEKSLLAQESFDDFESRVFRKMGVGPLEKATGSMELRAMDIMIETEARIAWNEATAEVGNEAETVGVWEAVLDDRTTPACWEAHGKTVEQLGGEVPPRHPRCRCRIVQLPNPDSDDKAWSSLGRDVIGEMNAERISGQAAA